MGIREGLQAANAEFAEAMKAELNAGQGDGDVTPPAPPAGDDKSGQKDASASQTDAKKDGEVDKAGAGGEKKDGEEALPFDKHPKWISARQAEKRLNETLAKLGLESIDELTERAEAGESLKSILGGKDPKKLIEDAEYLAKVKEYWAQQEALKKEQEETPEETITRLKKEKDEILKGKQAEEASKQELQTKEQAVTEYNKIVNTALTSSGISGKAAELTKLVLAIDNPLVDLGDITDKKAVKAAADNVLNQVKTIMESIKQEVIAEYGKSKGGIPNVPTTTGAAIDTSVVEEDDSKLTVAQRRARADNEVLKILLSAKDAIDNS